MSAGRLPLQVVLTEEQREEKKAAEDELKFAKFELEKAVDPVQNKQLTEEVEAKEKKLEELTAGFEVHKFIDRSND